MEALITFVLNFIYSSATLALIVLGLAMVFGLLGVMNMAHGEFVMLGAYSAYVVQSLGLNFIWAIPISILVCVIVGWLMEWTIIRHLYNRPFDTLLATWGVAILIRKGIEAIFSRDYKSVDQVMPGNYRYFRNYIPFLSTNINCYNYFFICDFVCLVSKK